MPIKKNDFVELDYTGKLKDENIVFDTTKEAVAKVARINNANATYAPITICVGQQHLVPGLDRFLEGKDVGTFSVELKPEDAFGKKDAKLMAMVPTNKFLQQKINPMPGLQVNIDGAVGIIRTVNGGRSIVDFNHPLAGKTVVYELEIKSIVADKQKKVEALGKILLGRNVKIQLDKDTAKVELTQDVPKEVVDEFEKKFQELIGVKFAFVKPEEKKEEKKKDETKKQ